MTNKDPAAGLTFGMHILALSCFYLVVLSVKMVKMLEDVARIEGG